MSNTKVILITGVSSGIGQVTAKKMAELGHTVFGTVRNLKTAQKIENVELVEMDICDEVSIHQAITHVVEKSGRIDVLVNNAGVSLIGAIEETALDEAQALFNTNVFGILRTVKAVLPVMRSQRSGRIINLSSVLGFLPSPYMGLYAATKHAVEGLSESLDHEVRQFGIRVALVQPTFTKTNLDKNSATITTKIADYDHERHQATQAILHQIDNGAQPSVIADAVIKAAFGDFKMRFTPTGQATLLSALRRVMPATLIGKSIRKTFNLE